MIELQRGIALTKKVKSTRTMTNLEYQEVAQFWEWSDQLKKDYEVLLESKILTFLEANADDIYETLMEKIESLNQIIADKELIINKRIQDINQSYSNHKDYETIKSIGVMQDDWEVQSFYEELHNVKRALFNCIPHLKRIKVNQPEGEFATLIFKAKQYPIMSLVSQEKMRRMGNKMMTLSPLRNEKTPSFCVYLDTNTWFDYGGGEGGDVITLYQKINNCDFKDAVRVLAN